MTSFSPNSEGVFNDLSFAEYRDAPGVSQSMLKDFDAEPTPAHYLESLSRPRTVTEAMEFGTVLHAAILTPEKAHESYYLQPLSYPGPKCPKPWHNGADYCKEWVRAHSDRIIIDAQQEARIPRIVETVLSLPVVGDILRTGQKEVSFFKRDEETGLLLKCRVDAIATDTEGLTFIADLKKVRRGYAREDRFGVICADLGYDIQCAAYLAITGATRFLFAAMEEEAPYEAETYELSPEDTAEGYAKWRKILLRYAEACAAATWPGYSRTVKRLKLPAWAKDRQRREAESIYV